MMVRFASALPNAEFCTADNETCNASALSRAQTVSSVLGSSASAESKREERERERATPRTASLHGPSPHFDILNCHYRKCLALLQRAPPPDVV